jgi:uncharacterized protein (DUF697 family)
MVLDQDQLQEVVKQLTQAVKLQGGAWDRVKRSAHAWALMKLHGKYLEDNSSGIPCMVSINHSDRERMEKYYHDALMRDIEATFLEDALASRALSDALTN